MMVKARRNGLVAGMAFLWLLAVPGRAADPESPDWPCIQRKVPEISAGMMWAGPPVQEDDRSWRRDEKLAALVGELAERRLPIEQAELRIDEFAAGLDADKDQKLTLLFTGLLQDINAVRGEIIEGIERYTRRQRDLADKVRSMTVELAEMRARTDATEEERATARKLEEELVWQTRIFDEREQSLTYVCESPVLLEQRLFALARQIMNHLEE